MVVLLRLSNAPFEKAEQIEKQPSQKTSRGRNILSVHIQVWINFKSVERWLQIEVVAVA